MAYENTEEANKTYFCLFLFVQISKITAIQKKIYDRVKKMISFAGGIVRWCRNNESEDFSICRYVYFTIIYELV